ncbi:MAG: hypothetical protein H6513_10045 [Acidimicrobiaceae bacterium]|nr:hypothetical protein [Ilumatobacter sp.]MCB9381017.1 hypothetical protein [Acidimicrobiaceae bacterium]MCO5330781.1 hypothetical protein [Ilumatobacteraceae bacterium]
MATIRPAVRAAGAAALGILLLAPAPAHAGSETFDQCVARKVGAGVERAVAVTQCMQSTASTVAQNNPITPTASGSDDGGTSVGALLAAAAAGLVVGALGMKLLKGNAPAAATPAPAAMPPAGAPMMAPAAPPMMAPAPAAASAPDGRADTLIAALIDLGDRVNSAALRAEISAALARAGVQVLDPPPGTPFDAQRMRGVGSTPATDPSTVGTVAATDRVGYASATALLRLPDVIVHVAS